jgi:hypothetical protein
LIGAGDDDTVTSGSATGMTANVGHRIIHCGGQGIEHNVIMKKTTGSSWCQQVWHHYRRYCVTLRSYPTRPGRSGPRRAERQASGKVASTTSRQPTTLRFCRSVTCPGAVRWRGLPAWWVAAGRLEILLVADDVDGPAEQYGHVNRVIADDQLDDKGRGDRLTPRARRSRRDRLTRSSASPPGRPPAAAAPALP